jgi:hypothetical protein
MLCIDENVDRVEELVLSDRRGTAKLIARQVLVFRIMAPCSDVIEHQHWYPQLRKPQSEFSSP